LTWIEEIKQVLAGNYPKMTPEEEEEFLRNNPIEAVSKKQT